MTNCLKIIVGFIFGDTPSEAEKAIWRNFRFLILVMILICLVSPYFAPTLDSNIFIGLPTGKFGRGLSLHDQPTK